MVNIPDKIINKSAVKIRNALAFMGVFCGLLAYGGFSNGDNSFGVKVGLLAALLLFIASKVRTTKTLRGAGGIYK